MKNLKAMLYGAFALVFASISATPGLAGSSDFEGGFISVQASVNGMELEGQHTDNNGDVTKGQGGEYAAVGGVEIGYNFPVDDSFFITVGANYIPVDAEFKGDDAANAADVTITTKDHYTFYIAPSVSVYDNSALYLKIGYSEGETSATGDVTGKPNDLEGHTIAVGTTTIFESGAFVRTEAGAHIYDEVKITGIGGNTASTLKGDPSIAYGALTLGIQF